MGAWARGAGGRGGVRARGREGGGHGHSEFRHIRPTSAIVPLYELHAAGRQGFFTITARGPKLVIDMQHIAPKCGSKRVAVVIMCSGRTAMVGDK